MPEQIFTIEILETWVSKKKVKAESRSDALAKVKAELVGSDKKHNYNEPDNKDIMELRSVDVLLEWPDGNPEEIKVGG